MGFTRFIAGFAVVAIQLHAPTPTTAQDLAYRLWAEDNIERAARGLTPTVWSDTLAAAALDWSTNHLPLTGEDTPGVQANVIGRGGCPTDPPSPCYDIANLPTDGSAHVGWMQSAGHRDNIVDPAVTTEGVGVFCGPHGILYATEIFTTPADAPPEPSSTPDPIAYPSTGGLTCAGVARP